MDALKTFLDHLASPPWLFGLALVIFLAGRGSKRPWSTGGGVLLLVLAAGFWALGLSDENFRRLVLDPERLPVAVLLQSSAVLLWFEMSRLRRGAELASSNTGFSNRDLAAGTVVVLLVVGCALIYPTSLGPMADPGSKPELVRVPWFFLGLQELDHYFDPWVPYLALPLLFLAGLLAMPFLEPGERTPGRGTRALFLFAWLLLWLGPMAVAAFLRGPHWNAFGFFEPWDASRPAPPPPLDLAEVFWGRWLYGPQPEQWWIRELPGMLWVAAFFGLLPMALLRWKVTRDMLAEAREALGAWRFHAAAAGVLALAIVPLKMLGRWWLNVGLWIHLPELSFSF